MKCFHFIFIFLIHSTVLSQTDSASVLPKTHSPKKAILMSALLPGAGQVYNHLAMPKGQKRAYWKVPLIYAGLGASTYFLYSNQQKVTSLKKEYTNRMEGNTTNPEWEMYDDQGVLSLFSQYQTSRDLSILGLVAVYLIQVADAGVEAHFVKFDVSKNLSMSFSPSVSNYGQPLLKTTLTFH